MNSKHIPFILFFINSTFLFSADVKQIINSPEFRECIRREVQQSMEPTLWALRNLQPNHPLVQAHIHTSSNASSASNPIVQTSEPQSQNFQKLLDDLSAKSTQAGGVLQRYQWYIGGGVLTSCYLYIWYQIYQINKLLDNPCAWHLFKEEIPLTRLTIINRTELFKELQLAICKKYLNAADCASSQKIMLKFLEDVTYEKALLESYIIYQSCINSCYLTKIFPTFKKIEYVQESIARLNFLKDLYIEFFVIKESNK
jgi:hypothetical protein